MVVLLMGVSILAYLDRLSVSFLIDPMKSDIGMTDTQAGMLVGLAFSLLYVTMGLPIGYLVDSRPRHVVLGICIFFWSVMQMISGLCSTFVGLFLARCGVGAGEAAVHPAAISIIGDTFAPDRVARPIAVYGIGLWLGGGLSIVLGGQLVAYFTALGAITIPGFGTVPAWRLVLISIGLPGFLATGLIALTLRNTPRKPRELPTAMSLPRQLKSFLQQEYEPFALIAAGYISFGFVLYNILAWYPSLLMRTYGLSSKEVSIGYGLPYLIMGIAGSITSAPLVRRLQSRGVFEAPLVVAKWCMLLALVPAIVGPIMPNAIACFGCLAITVFFWALHTSVLYTAFILGTPREMRGIMISAQAVVLNVTAGAFGPMLVGSLSDHVFGSKRIGYSISVTALVAMPLAALLFKLAQPSYRDLVAKLSPDCAPK